ncbi:MAG: chorismate synthase [Phycisphaerae bacterium]|nr:chorismate synthase [Phycisphaerae bacterium]
MPTLDYQTAGESHGPALLTIVTGVPAGLAFDAGFINGELARRQGGYGRGGRQNIEKDRVTVLAGVRRGRTTGAPVALQIVNRDSRLDDPGKTPAVYRPRPGHADLAGSVKWLTTDCRDTLERASARETAARVAAGALARLVLRVVGIETFGFVRSILDAATDLEVREDNWRALAAVRDASDTYCPDPDASERQRAAIRRAKVDQDTVGGLVETHVFGCPPGIGSCVDWRLKLDARLAYAVMGVQAIKCVEIGLGKGCGARPGSNVHDPIVFDAARRQSPSLGFVRTSNNAGGTEGGMTNGQPVVVRATMKPISTLLRGMPSVDLNTKAPERSAYERSDVCAVPAASVVVENVAAFEVARCLLEKIGGDSVLEMRTNFESYMKYASMLPLDPPETTLA